MISSIIVTPSRVTLEVGEWYNKVIAQVYPIYENCHELYWYSDNTYVATVNMPDGAVCARNPGIARIYAETTDGSYIRDYIEVEVTSENIYVSSVTLNKKSLSLKKGKKYTLTAMVLPSNATNKSVRWRSTNDSVVTVTDGIVFAKSKGYAYIYATAKDGSGKTNSCYVNVT